MVQLLKGIFEIFRKQVCGQIEWREENNKPQGKIRPEQQGSCQVGNRFQVFVYLRVQGLGVQRFRVKVTANRRTAEFRIQNVEGRNLSIFIDSKDKAQRFQPSLFCPPAADYSIFCGSLLIFYIFLIIKQVLTPPKAKFWIAAMRISDSTSSWAWLIIAHLSSMFSRFSVGAIKPSSIM